MSKRSLLLAAGLVMLAACGSGGGGRAGGSVRLSDFAIAVGPVKAGRVAFSVSNKGPSAHDLVVVRTDLSADALPAPGGTADASAAGVERVGGTDPIVPGGKAKVSVDLAAGKYVLVCTLPGHYGQGMFRAVTVP